MMQGKLAMPIAPGVEVYDVSHAPVVATGIVLNNRELDGALATSVASILRDDPGQEELEETLANVANTTFATEGLREALDVEISPLGWRVGEAIAEAYLVEHRDCSFPWPGGRDLKNPNASPAGTDLVGFQRLAGASGHRFAFGEVKTSRDSAVPPSVVTGRHGLIVQVETLRDSNFTKDCLLKYLAFHAHQRPWAVHFREAATRYLQDKSDVALFGILVRDVNPDGGDLASRAERISIDCPVNTLIELKAIYLPHDSIEPDPPAQSLSERAIAALTV
jgi:hypothetical protein